VRGHRDQHVGPGVGGHPALVEVGVQLREGDGLSTKTTAAQIFSPR
jgi:hypothetical protein